jgi:regulator of protease activity HflC (stomatin/prohibitin superfamily)
MPAAVPILLAVTAATAVGSMVEQNQQTQHAKGAAEAQNTAMQAQIDQQTKTDAATQTQKANQGSATQAAALAALRASMSASSGMGGSILTSPTGTTPAPTTTKSLLGV